MREADSFEFGILVLFLFNNEHILLLEEDLNYDPLSSPRQFKIVDNAKISDIVHLVGEPLLFDSFLLLLLFLVFICCYFKENIQWGLWRIGGRRQKAGDQFDRRVEELAADHVDVPCGRVAYSQSVYSAAEEDLGEFVLDWDADQYLAASIYWIC